MNFETVPFSSMGSNKKVIEIDSFGERFNVSVSDNKQSQVEIKSIFISVEVSLCNSSFRVCMPESLVIEPRFQVVGVMDRAVI